ncbi:hypothetical protein L1887_53499 [Cichorium endivia]|nr:hypothetical protein L1887_53499 [Cichorium endivia]
MMIMPGYSDDRSESRDRAGGQAMVGCRSAGHGQTAASSVFASAGSRSRLTRLSGRRAKLLRTVCRASCIGFVTAPRDMCSNPSWKPARLTADRPLYRVSVRDTPAEL